MSTITYTSRLTVEECCSCHILFGIPENLYEQRRRDHKLFYCPNGHSQHYTGQTPEQRLRRENEELERRLASTREDVRAAQADAEVERNRARAFKGHATRVRRRAAAGKCPCCSVDFPDLAAHIAAEHPGFSDEEVTP